MTRKKKDELARKETDKPVKVEDAPLAVKDALGDPTETEEIRRQLAEKTELAQAYYAQLQRAQADFENYRKRVEAERARIADGACETIISGLLDTLDNFDRAMASLEKLPQGEAEGVLMVYRGMLDYLRENGLERIAATGCQFDPHRHEAVMQADAGDAGDGTVLEEFQAGYAVKGRVVRPSKVKVARKREGAPDDNTDNKNNNIEMEE